MVVSSRTEDDHVATDNDGEKYETHKDGRTLPYINCGEDDEMEIQGFVHSKLKTRIVWVFYILTIGILRLFFHWYPHLLLKATHTQCHLSKAEKVLVIDTYKKFKSFFVKEIKTLRAIVQSLNGEIAEYKNRAKCLLEFNLCDGRQKKLYQARIIRCKKLTYIWDDEKNTFIKLAGFDKGITRGDLHSIKGQTKEKQIVKRIIYGNNEINVPVQTVLTLLVLEALTPFYIFQLFSLIVWLFEEYYYYTVAIIIMSVAGICTSILQTRKNQMNLRGTVNYIDTAIVCRGNDVFEEIPTTDLVPGDLIVIPASGCEMQCDAVLLTGSCVVNESMLTGESVPITKTPLPDNSVPYKLKEDVNQTLFCGTKIIQTRSKGDEKVYAVVIRTGYLTTKGELVRSILYPPPADFKFETDSYHFIGILALIALLGVIYTIVSKSSRSVNALDILIKSLDLITIAIPPALPAAMTVGKLYAINRLKNKKIYCINSRVINVTGSIDCICFDKTGTLTEDELDMWGIVPVENNEIKQPLKDAKLLLNNSSLLRGMAACHSLSVVNGELGGDPLDIKMFESTGWHLQEFANNGNGHYIIVKPKAETSNEANLEIGIVKQFQFSSQLQRMSVVIKPSDTEEFSVFCKGSPEMIMSLSRESSVPEDLLTRLKYYTVQGYRVIALSKKSLGILMPEGVAKLNREKVECDLEFIGLIVLENKLKAQTTDVIKTLKLANLKVVMITGDNLQTGVHVARECQMVDLKQTIVEIVATEATKFDAASINYHVTGLPISQPQCSGNSLDIESNQTRSYCFAVTGTSWANIVMYFPELVPKIIAKGIVFARMSGMQKQQLIEEFKNLGYYVAMCGDGANDCGALKAAHVGVSLSEAESSVASPFTSKEQNISCIPEVIKEGRAALITSFGVFKVMVCYSLAELISVMILYNIDANLAAFQFLFIDICLILNFASFFGITRAYPTLDKTPPRTSLMSFIPISSLVLFLLVCTVFQLVGYFWIQTYSWFEPFIFNESDRLNYVCYENFSIFVVSIFQYITMIVVFSKGKPYRKPLHTNIYLTASLLVTTAGCVYMSVYPTDWIINIMELKLPPMEGRYAMIMIALINFIICAIVEDFIVEYVLAKVISPKFKSFGKSKRKYMSIFQNFNEDASWPVFFKENSTSTELNERKSNGIINNGFVGSQNTLDTKF